MIPCTKFRFILIVSFLFKCWGLFTEDAFKSRQSWISSSSHYGPFIVQLTQDVLHSDFDEFVHDYEVNNPFIRFSSTISHRFHHVYHGLVIEGLTLQELRSFPMIRSVSPVTKRRLMDSYSWGIDRINQRSLPLDKNIESFYDGRNVDVYVVDTGLDSTHIEFQGNLRRMVSNIFDAFSYQSNSPLPANTDNQGHGTHVAATIGGRSVGVAPGANIYGVRVLSDSGEGDTSDIIAALDFIVSRASSRTANPSVVSMSLGGPCDVPDCSRDALVMAVEATVAVGIVVSVAAGNEGCNACTGSPNAAPNAVNVGAIDKNDHVAYFSNFGQCVDVFAPGMDIVSACSSAVCGRSDSYWTLSGTSMACPHVSGVIAQMRQKYPHASPAYVMDFLACAAVPGALTLLGMDSISRNLLLQMPPVEELDSNCTKNFGCLDDCSGNGMCLARPSITSSVACYCDGGYFGPSCASNLDPLCHDSHTNVVVSMIDSFGDGWTFTNYAIVDESTGFVVDGAFDSLCYGSSGAAAYCIPNDHCYDFVVTRGYFPEEVGWSVCDSSGGAPFTLELCVNYTGHCFQRCSGGIIEKLQLIDAFGDGWEGGYYAIYNSLSGIQTHGGTLIDEAESQHDICLAVGCYVMVLEHKGRHPKEISFSICGYQGSASSMINICVLPSLECVVTEIVSSKPLCSISDNVLSLAMFSIGSHGWQGANVAVLNRTSPIHNSSIISGFIGLDQFCLPDGCYDFLAHSSGDLTVDKNIFWLLCDQKGVVPFSSRLCVDATYNLCYGLSGCASFVSHAHSSDFNYYFITHSDVSQQKIDTFDNIHGAHELCDLEDGCYEVHVGGGKLSNVGDRTSVTFCESVSVSIPSKGKLCISGNSTKCSMKDVVPGQCPSPIEMPLQFIKIDTYGDGWGRNVYYYIKAVGKAGNVVASGQLLSGEFGADELCLSRGQCYTISLQATEFANEIVWLLCGYIGGAPSRNLQFCLTDTGCMFTDLDDDSWDVEDDDDFPLQTQILSPTPSPSLLPTRLPSLSPSFIPTAMPSPFSPKFSASPSYDPSKSFESTEIVTLACNLTIRVKMGINSNLVKNYTTGVRFVTYAVRHVLESQGISIWASYNDLAILLPGDSSRMSKFEKFRGKGYALKAQDNVNHGTLRVSLHLSITRVTGAFGDQILSIDRILEEALSQGKLQQELAYCFYRLPCESFEQPVVTSIGVDPNFPYRSIFVPISDSAPTDDLYEILYPSTSVSLPIPARSKNIHIKAIVVISAIVISCLALLLIIKSWLRHTKRQPSSSLLTLDLDASESGARTNMGLGAMTADGYGKVRTNELDESGAGASSQLELVRVGKPAIDSEHVNHWLGNAKQGQYNPLHSTDQSQNEAV